MVDIVLFDYFRSSASYRVRIALKLKGVEYETVATNLLAGGQRAPDYIARNPQGFVPVLSIDDHDLTQSLAIIDYLDARFPDPPMLPSEAADRARVLAQALIIVADIHPLNNLRILKYLEHELGLDGDAIGAWYRKWITEGFGALEKMAPEKGFFGGRQPNLADVCLIPQMYNARRYDTPLGPFPHLARIDAEMNDLEPVRAAHPDLAKPSE